MSLDPTSHNLRPFEFALYAGFALLAGVGAGLGAFLRVAVRSERARRGAGER
jgi:hypothetical protein